MKKSLIVTTLLFNVVNAEMMKNTTALDSITIIGEDDSSLKIEKINGTVQNIEELLKNDSRIDISGGTPNAKRLYIRGISEALTTITIDGARQSKDLHQHRGGLANIDTNLLKSVKINPGVASADSGYGNLGGNIKFVTVDAQDLLEDKNYGAYIKTNYATVNDSYKNSIALYGKLHQNIGLLLYGSKADADDYQTGAGIEVPRSSEEFDNYMAKLSILDLEGHSLKLSHEENLSEGSYINKGGGSDFDYITSEKHLKDLELERKTSILNYTFNSSNKLIDASLKVFKNSSELNNKTDNEKIKSEESGLDLRNIFTFSNSTLENILTVGFDYEKSKGTSEKNSTVEFENKGFFVQNRLDFDKLYLSLGARYDSYENDLIYKNADDSELSTNIYTEYYLNNYWTVFVGYGEASSGASTIPVSWLARVDSTLTFNGSDSSNLKTQKSKKYEFGTSFKKDNIFTQDDSLAFKFTVFNTNIDNQIVVGSGGRGGENITDIINIDEIKLKGFESSIAYNIGDFKTSLAYLTTDVKENGKTVETVQRRRLANHGDKINVNLAYKPSNNLSISYSILGMLENKDALEKVHNKSGYAVHNISTTYKSDKIKNLSIYFSINNIFDKNYASQTSVNYSSNQSKFPDVLVLNEPGRDFRIGLKYVF